jgi:hypothetical protein
MVGTELTQAIDALHTQLRALLIDLELVRKP